jgi:hypothetical protein
MYQLWHGQWLANRVTRLGKCFLWAVLFEKLKNYQFFGLRFDTEIIINALKLTNKELGHILGDFFHKLIWSPCLPT